MHELAESLLVSRSATTRFIDRMEGAGLVQRRSCDSDRRGTFVALTDEGRRVLAQAAPIHLRGIQEHFSGHLSQREAVELNRLLEKLLSAQRVRTHH
jgi:DNA-binding MarR family transcriptional regulator